MFTTQEKLLEVPLVAAGEFDPRTTVRITVGLDPTAANAGTDVDHIIGLTDGNNENLMRISDTANLNQGVRYCLLDNSQSENPPLGVIEVPGVVTSLFQPFYRYGACSTANNAGYTNVGTFNTQLDISNGISFTVSGDNEPESYRYYYFLIEML